MSLKQHHEISTENNKRVKCKVFRLISVQKSTLKPGMRSFPNGFAGGHIGSETRNLLIWLILKNISNYLHFLKFPTLQDK